MADGSAPRTSESVSRALGPSTRAVGSPQRLPPKCDQTSPVSNARLAQQGEVKMTEHVLSEPEPAVVLPLYTPTEWQLLKALRELYERDHDLLLSDERARLSFIRWLVNTKRLIP